MAAPSGSADELKISISSEPLRPLREDRHGTTIPLPTAMGDTSADTLTDDSRLPQVPSVIHLCPLDNQAQKIKSAHEQHPKRKNSALNMQTDLSKGPRTAADSENCQRTSVSIKIKLKIYWWRFTQI